MRPARLFRTIALAAALAVGAGATARAGDVPTLREAGGTYRVHVLSYKEMPFRNVVHQERDFSCGSAALATLLRYYVGYPIEEESIFKAMWKVGDQKKIREVGFSLLDMKLYLKTIGFEADGYKVPLQTLLDKQAPTIVVMKTGAYKHFVVLKGVKSGFVLLADPAFGLRAERVDRFAKEWQGVAFLIHGAPDVVAAMYNRREDWAQLPQPPLEFAAREQPSASELMRHLPPIYQIAPVFHVGPQ